MKKVISVIIAVLMLASICIPSFAATITTDGSSTSIVKTKTVDESGDDAAKFTVIIPATTEIPWGKASQDLTYSVESHLGYGKKLSVAVSGSDKMTYTVGSDVMTLAYTLGGTTSYLAAGPALIHAAKSMDSPEFGSF